MDRPFFILGSLILTSWSNRPPGAAALQAPNQADTEAPAVQPADTAGIGSELTIVDEDLPPGLQVEPEAQIEAPASTRRSTARYPAFEEENEEAPDRTPPQRLIIPALGVDATVVLKPFTGKTWDIRGLQTDVAWLEGTAHPDEGGNTVLAGHIMVRSIGRGPFRYLDRLKPGARVLVYTEQKKFTYHVREHVIVKDTEGEVTMDTGLAQLTLLTCTTWDAEEETYLRRRAVFADLVEVESLPPGDVW